MSTAEHEATERLTELTELAQALAPHRPALITLTGPGGSGKSFVATAFLRAATESGWQVTSYRNGRGIRVGAGTTVDDVVHDVSAALGISTDTTGRRPLRRLTERLGSHAQRTPSIVVLDPYAPEPALEDRLKKDLFDPVRSSSEPVVLLIMSRTSLRKRLNPDLEIEIATPSADSLRARLRAVTSTPDAAIDETELSQYVAAARSSPRLLASLLAVLPLGVPSSDQPDGAALRTRPQR